MTKKDLGQYFTKSEYLQQAVFDLVLHKSECLLEPSFGRGDLLIKFKNHNENYPMICYEIDESIVPIIHFNQYQKIFYQDFTKQKLEKFKTIIANPPYVKRNQNSNLYIHFISLCYEILEEDGEMIFIVPSDFIKLTSASLIIEKMNENGSFTHFIFPNDEQLFENASIDILIFRYQKGLKIDKCFLNQKEIFYEIHEGIITFNEKKIKGISIQEIFHVYVGMVSGRDEIYKVPFGNIDILNDENKIEKYIYIDSFPSSEETIDSHLINHKNELMSRKIKKFNEKNWFEWGAPRNISVIRKFWNEKCIYIRTLTRKKQISFIGNVQYFGGSLLCLIPKNKNEIELEKIIEYLNSQDFQKNYLYSGRFKIGHKQISNVIVPY